MVDVRALRGAYESYEISDVGWVYGRDNPADGLTKPGECASLNNILDHGTITVRTRQ